MRRFRGKIYTAFMVAVSFTAVFGGWFLTKELLDRKEQEFLDGTGAIALRSSQTALLAQEEADEEEHAFKKQEISEELMHEILLLWDFGDKEMPHDPKEGQMNMEQAIETGKQWIAALANYEIVPYTLMDGDFDKITAQLGTVEAETDLDERLLSRWILEYRKDDVDITLMIHAMSGEVWYANISVMEYSSMAHMYSTEEMLEIMFPREGKKELISDTANQYDNRLIKVLEKGLVGVEIYFRITGAAIQTIPAYEISFWLEPL